MIAIHVEGHLTMFPSLDAHLDSALLPPGQGSERFHSRIRAERGGRFELQAERDSAQPS
jgi:hypothetical protein